MVAMTDGGVKVSPMEYQRKLGFGDLKMQWESEREIGVGRLNYSRLLAPRPRISTVAMLRLKFN